MISNSQYRRAWRHCLPWFRKYTISYAFFASISMMTILSMIWGIEAVYSETRMWVGALSGWAAAAGAFVIGVPTLKYLKDQARMPAIQYKIDSNDKVIGVYNSIFEWSTQSQSKTFAWATESEFKTHFFKFMHGQLNVLPESLREPTRAKIFGGETSKAFIVKKTNGVRPSVDEIARQAFIGVQANSTLLKEELQKENEKLNAELLKILS